VVPYLYVHLVWDEIWMLEVHLFSDSGSNPENSVFATFPIDFFSWTLKRYAHHFIKKSRKKIHKWSIQVDRKDPITVAKNKETKRHPW
jgi:hypothetical protein